MQQISATQLKAWLDDGTRPTPLLLDVREPWEFDTCRIPGAQLVPMRSVPARLAEIDRGAEVVVICHHGGRSFQVGMFLEQSGYAHVTNLQGGVDGWAREVDPAMPTY